MTIENSAKQSFTKCVAIVGNKQEFLYWCHENEIPVRRDGVSGESGNTTYVCCNTEHNARGRRFDDAIFLRSSYLDKSTSHVADIVMQHLRHK